MVAVKAAEEIGKEDPSDFWKISKLSALGTKCLKNGNRVRDIWAMEKLAKSAPNPLRYQWTLSVSSTERPIAVS